MERTGNRPFLWNARHRIELLGIVRRGGVRCFSVRSCSVRAGAANPLPLQRSAWRGEARRSEIRLGESCHRTSGFVGDQPETAFGCTGLGESFHGKVSSSFASWVLVGFGVEGLGAGRTALCMATFAGVSHGSSLNRESRLSQVVYGPFVRNGDAIPSVRTCRRSVRNALLVVVWSVGVPRLRGTLVEGTSRRGNEAGNGVGLW